MEGSVWQKALDMVSGPKQAEAAQDYKNHPGYHDAQKRSMSHYGKTGEQRPLKDFIDDPSLK